MIRRFLRNYPPRHRNRANQLLHAVGVPLTFVGTPVCLAAGKPWYFAAGCFVGGYVLQFVGHAIEGNDAGEAVFLKKRLGLPFTEYGPEGNPSSLSESGDDTTTDSAP